METTLNAWEQMIQAIAKCNDIEAQRIYAHAEDYGDVDWSEITVAELKREVKIWMQEIESGMFN